MEGGPERLKCLGACGMFKESFRVIFARKKLFAQITLALILPLALFFLAQSTVTQLILEETLKTDDHRKINYDQADGEYAVLKDKNYGWTVILAIKVVYFTVVLILSLLATSAVAYAVACVCTSKDVTFKKVARTALVPKILKRLIITFLWIYLVFIVFSVILVGLIFLCALIIKSAVPALGIILVIVLVIAYIVGIVYLAIVWELAFVVSVLEDGPVYGRAALSKSRALINGKLWSIVGCLLLLILCFGLVEAAFEFIVALGDSIKSVAIRVVVGVVFWFVLAFENLVTLAATAVIYLVCKSYHQESLDLPLLTDGLEIRREAAKDVQLEQV